MKSISLCRATGGLFLLSGFGLAACGASQPASETPAAGQDSATAAEPPPAEEPGAPAVPWHDKTRAQKMEYMGLVVYPRMKEAFVAFDAEGFKDFKCQTCHGEDMEAVDFKMPNALYALSATDPMGSARDYDEKVAAFMTETVVPAMTELLGEEPYRPETHQGFGCFECHQKEE